MTKEGMEGRPLPCKGAQAAAVKGGGDQSNRPGLHAKAQEKLKIYLFTILHLLKIYVHHTKNETCCGTRSIAII